MKRVVFIASLLAAISIPYGAHAEKGAEISRSTRTISKIVGNATCLYSVTTAIYNNLENRCSKRGLPMGVDPMTYNGPDVCVQWQTVVIGTMSQDIAEALISCTPIGDSTPAH